MLTFTNPSAWPLLSLLVPLAIHLWNRRPGQEVAVGSLRWLAAGANRRLRNLRLEQLWLLLLRAALLASLAVAVAGPAWRQPLSASRGQVLVSPSLLGNSGALASVRPVIDSLRQQGYALRWLSRGLPLLPAAAWRADSLGQPLPLGVAATLPNSDAFYAERIWQAADAFPGQPLYVLTPSQLVGVQGSHRPLPPGLTWQTLPLATPTTWLQAATSTADSLYLVLGRSTERQTAFTSVRVGRPQAGQRVKGPGLPALRYELAGQGQPQVQPVASSASASPTQAPVPVSSARLRVWVYATAAYADDARYLRAGLRAASVGLPGPLDLTVAPTLPDTTAAPDWLFWLSAAPVPAAWRGQVRQGLHLWQAAAGPGAADTTLLIAPELLASAPITLWRRASLPLAAGTEPVWTDAQGRAILTRRAVGQGEIYQAAIRLSSTWSTLPDNPALPALLLDVVRPALSGSDLARFRAHDQRRLDPTQLAAPATTAAVAAPTAYKLRDLRPWLVLVAGLLLVLERWLAARRRASTSFSLA